MKSIDQRPVTSAKLIKSSLRFAFWTATVIWITHPAPGQEALRSSLAGTTTAEATQARENVPYNIRAGPVSLLFDGSLALDYLDNLNVSEINVVDDFIISPRIDTRAYWPLSEQNTLNFTIGIGYAKYIEHSENDTLLIRPGSEISFDVYISDFRINVHDRFSYFQDPISQPAVSGGTNAVADYGIADNVAGVRVDWDLNKLLVSVGYDYLISIATGSGFDYLDHTAQYFYVRPTVFVRPTFSTGLDVTAGFTDYDEQVNTDNTQFSMGPFVDWQLSPNLRLGMRVGYVIYTFDQSGGTTNVPDNSSIYSELTINHRANQYFSHLLTGGSQLQQGINSNSLQFFFGRYVAILRFVRRTAVTTEFYYEHGDESVPTTGAAEETFDRIGATLALNYQLTRKLSTTLTYSYAQKFSNLPLRDYTQNHVSLDFTYRF